MQWSEGFLRTVTNPCEDELEVKRLKSEESIRAGETCAIIRAEGMRTYLGYDERNRKKKSIVYEVTFIGRTDRTL